LLRQPDLLIFDEATSHLDTATERLIRGNLKTAAAGKTVVLVAHRLSTVKDADYIYVLHAGRVAEEGTHRQLLAQHGWYAALWQHQTDDRACDLDTVLFGRRNGVAVPEEVGHD